MIQIDNILISDALYEEHFCCDLKACKGKCCEVGEEGAPLDREEIPILDEIFEKVKPYMISEGIEVIEKSGTWKRTDNNGFATPLIGNEGRCAFICYDEKQTAMCSIEKAFNDGLIQFKKPISCHLYPVRVNKYPTIEAVNYEKWDICEAACSLGEALKLPVYKFLKEPLIRRYGEEFFNILDAGFKHQAVNK